MSSVKSGIKQTVIALLVLSAHCTITMVAHYLQNISSFAPIYMHHLCQCASSIVDLSRAHDLVGRDVLHENIQTWSKDSQVKTQLVLWIFILFKVTR